MFSSRIADVLVLSICLGLLPSMMLVNMISQTVVSNLAGHEYLPSILIQICIGIIAMITTIVFVPIGARYTLRAGLSGKDIGKKGTPDEDKSVPESLGVVSGIVYVICVISLNVYFGTTVQRLLEYNAALHSISFILFLGFADDVLDIPWKVKILFPFISSLPLLTAYSGSTSILVPTFISNFLGLEFPILDLGYLYLLYMLLLACFCTNSINILAGINGLEVGQTCVISSFIILLNLMELTSDHSHTSKDSHFLSLSLMIPFLFTNIGLLYWNWYPSQVFVGDTFTLFAGMTLAVSGILGHFSKTLLLFFIPQLINFIYSIPQLFGIVPCPRHRLPRLDVSTGLMHGNPKHMNLINLILCIFGPMQERSLCIFVLALQFITCSLALVARHWIAFHLFGNLQ